MKKQGSGVSHTQSMISGYQYILIAKLRHKMSHQHSSYIPRTLILSSIYSYIDIFYVFKPCGHTVQATNLNNFKLPFCKIYPSICTVQLICGEVHKVKEYRHRRKRNGKKEDRLKGFPCCWLASWFQELERSWREYDRLEADVTLAKSNLLEQLEALGSPQVTHTSTHTQTLTLFLQRLRFEQHLCVCLCVSSDRTSKPAAHPDPEGAVEDPGRDGGSD